MQDMVTRASEAMDMTSERFVKESSHGGSLDVKEIRGHGTYDGFLFEGKYITRREAGDILFGFNAKIQGFTLRQTLIGAGAYQAGGDLGLAYAAWKGLLVPLGPPPYFGETAYSGRSIVFGYGLNLIYPRQYEHIVNVVPFMPFDGSAYTGIRGPC